MLKRFVPVLVCMLIVSLVSRSQQRLELLETNVAEAAMNPYGDSYLWTKNWWLSTGMLAAEGKGGPAIGVTSMLTKSRLDSLSKLFNSYISPKVMRQGGLKPRINYVKAKGEPYIQSTIFEINGEEVKAVCQFKITFSPTKHNEMPDIHDIQITPLEKMKSYDKAMVIKTYKRAATDAESNITPPEVVGME